MKIFIDRKFSKKIINQKKNYNERWVVHQMDKMSWLPLHKLPHQYALEGSIENPPLKATQCYPIHLDNIKWDSSKSGGIETQKVSKNQIRFFAKTIAYPPFRFAKTSYWKAHNIYVVLRIYLCCVKQLDDSPFAIVKCKNKSFVDHYSSGRGPLCQN